MKLYFKQRIFSWLDSYDVYDEAENVCFTVKGQLSWGHCLHIMNDMGRHVGTLKEVVLSFLPRFEIYAGDECIGSIKKEFTFFKPRFTLDMNGWTVEGNWLEWDYTILDAHGGVIAEISKQLDWSDFYVLDIPNPDHAIAVLMVVLAIDAEKCSRD